MPKQVEIPQIGTVTLYKRRNSRSLRLSIGAGGEVRVSMPHWVPYKSAMLFAAGKAEWIAGMRAERQTGLLQDRQPVGKAHHLYFRPASGERLTTRIRGQEIGINLPARVAFDDPKAQRAARTAAIRALRAEATMLLPQRLRDLAGQGGYTYNSVAIKNLKSRWGSCSSHQDIALNLFLMELPWHLIDYVLWHELTHTKVMRHGPPFWQELERHVPHARRLSRELHSHQPAI